MKVHTVAVSHARLVASIAFLLVTACATAPPEHAAVPSAESAAPINPYVQVVERVADRVHVMRQAQQNFAGVVGNVTIIEQADSIVLVDSGNTHGAGQRVVEAVRRISSKPVSAVIITHWHSDHPLGLTAIRGAWPSVEIISTEATRDRLATEANGGVPHVRDRDYEARRVATLQGYTETLTAGAQDPERSAEERAGWARAEASLSVRIADVPGTYVILPNRTFIDRLSLADPVTPIEVRFEGRANTDGDTVIWLPHQRVLIAGDTVVWPIPYEFNVYPAESIATLERLRAYDYRVLVPGHGEPLRDKRYLDLLIAFMREVRAQIAPLAQRGLTLEEATAQLDLEPYARAFAGDDQWLRLWFRDYALTPFIDSAFREAKGEPLGPAPIAAP